MSGDDKVHLKGTLVSRGRFSVGVKGWCQGDGSLDTVTRSLTR